MDDLIKSWTGTKISIEDARSYKPDIGFSEEKNKAVIAETIAKAKKRRAEYLKSKEYELRERTDAMASYIKFIETHDEINNTPEKYFGKKYLAHLRGQHILQTLFELKNGVRGIKTEYSDKIIE